MDLSIDAFFYLSIQLHKMKLNANGTMETKRVSFWVFARILVLAILVTVLHAFHYLPPVDITEDKVLELLIHRGIMFDYRGVERGSRGTFLRGEVVLGTSISERLTSHLEETRSSFRDKTVFLPCEEIGYQDLRTLVDIPVRGLIVEYCAEPSSTLRRQGAINQLLLASSSSIPIYFLSPGSEKKVAMIRESLKETASDVASLYRLSIKVGDQVPKLTTDDKEVPSPMVLGVLKPKKKGSLPPSAGVHVLLSAHFDSLATAPSLPTVSNALAVPALMELWRRFALYQGEGFSSRTCTATETSEGNSSSFLPYTITMALGSTSHLQYQGTEEWLRTEKSYRQSSKRPLVSICLDELLPSEEEWNTAAGEPRSPLYMHIHEGFADTMEGTELISKVKAAALATGVNVEVVLSSKRYSRSGILLEHQVFNHFKLPAVTFSNSKAYRAPSPPVDPYVGTEGLLSHLSQEKNSSRLMVRDVLWERVNFLHALVTSLITGVEPTSPDQGEEGRLLPAFLENDRFLVSQVQRAVRSLRSPSTLGVNSTEESSSLQTYAKELMGTMKTQVASPKSTVSATVDLQEWLVSSPNLLLYSSPSQTMIIFRGMLLKKKLIWSGVGIFILIVSGLFHYHQFPAPKSDEKTA